MRNEYARIRKHAYARRFSCLQRGLLLDNYWSSPGWWLAGSQCWLIGTFWLMSSIVRTCTRVHPHRTKNPRHLNMKRKNTRPTRAAKTTLYLCENVGSIYNGGLEGLGIGDTSSATTEMMLARTFCKKTVRFLQLHLRAGFVIQTEWRQLKNTKRTASACEQGCSVIFKSHQDQFELLGDLVSRARWDLFSSHHYHHL